MLRQALMPLGCALRRPSRARAAAQSQEAPGPTVVNAQDDLVALDGVAEEVPLGVRVVFSGKSSGVLLSRINSYAVVLLWPPGSPLPAPGASATVERVHAVVSDPGALLGQPAGDLAALLSFQPEAGSPPPQLVMAAVPPVPVRTPITRSLHTGVTAVDVLAPVGRGQVMLVVGEPGAGASELALDAVAAQRTTGVRCVYAALSSSARPAAAAGPHTALVSVEPGASPGVAMLALFAAFALAEAWRDAGTDALLVVDGCGCATAFWAACAALVPAPAAAAGASAEELVEFDGMLVSASAAERRRFFSSFLQRAARLNVENGGGSLTLLALLSYAPGAYRFGAGALAAAQAEASAARQKIAAYTTLSEVQKAKLLAALDAKAAAATAGSAAVAFSSEAVSRPIVEEFMSVSDGQVFLQPSPGGTFDGTWVVSPRDSVSRIGLDAAAPALRTAGCSSVRLELAQADDADSFADAAADSAHMAALRLRAALRQAAGRPLPLSQQVASLLALRAGVCNGIAPDAVPGALAAALDRLKTDGAALAALRDIDATGELSAAGQRALLAGMTPTPA